MVRSINNVSSSETVSLVSGSGIVLEGNEISIDASKVTFDTELNSSVASLTNSVSTIQLTQNNIKVDVATVTDKTNLLTTNQSTINSSVATLSNSISVVETTQTSINADVSTVNDKANLLSTGQSNILSTLNTKLLPYYDNTYKCKVSKYVSSRESSSFFNDNSTIWTNVNTGAINQELPNGFYVCKIVSGVTSNILLWEVMRVCHYVKNSNVNDHDSLPKTEIDLSYICHQNSISTDEVMKITVIRTPDDPVMNTTTTKIRFSGIPIENESLSNFTFTMRKVFDL